MPKIKEIFLDLDNVLNEFGNQVARLNGIEMDDTHNFEGSLYPVGYGWDIVGATNHILTQQGKANVSKSQFWKNLNTVEAWASIPKSKEFNTIMQCCLRIVGTFSRVHILTANPSTGIYSYAGKAEWCKRFLDPRISLIQTHNKHFLAAPDRLLLDDRNENVDRFMEYGGRAIMMPRPWNRDHAIQVSEGYDLSSYIEKCFNKESGFDEVI